jgi:AraC-like DNA-binding protein
VNPVPGEAISRRETGFLPDGTYLFRDQLKIRGVVTTAIVTCTAWLLEMYQLETGSLHFLRGKEEVRPNGNGFGVFYPPYALVRPCLVNAKGNLLGLAGTAPLPVGIDTCPFVFETNLPLEVRSVTEIFAAGRNRQAIDANPKASSLSLKAKKLIVESYSSNPLIARIAARLGVSNEHLSRQFRRDYGMSPREYLHQLRMADVPLELAKGGAIADISHDSGYGDLSRFYKQFRKTTGASPGLCREDCLAQPRLSGAGKLRSKSAKTMASLLLQSVRSEEEITLCEK